MNNDHARLCIAASESDANMYYATRFLVPDEFIFVEKNGKKLIVLSDLEIERGKHEARVDKILSLSDYRDQLQQEGLEYPQLIDITDRVLREHQISNLLVPGNFALQYADPLRERGYTVQYKAPFFDARAVKTAAEIEAIRQTQMHNEMVMAYAIQMLRDSDIGADELLYYQGTVLTSEWMRRQIQMKLLELDCRAYGTIVSCGDQAIRPHEHGSGPLRAHQAIIIDIFPQSLTTRYFADMTRTVVKGKASSALKRLYDMVQAGQEVAFKAMGNGVKGPDVHRQVQTLFKEAGYETGVIDGTMQGFFHGTGHGLGLEIHEPPRIGNVDITLQAGNVVTVEPGLYYVGIGGVRIEDLVVVTDNGCRNLTTYPKELEIG